MPTRRTILKSSLALLPFSEIEKKAHPKRIVFIGDSITDGNRGRNEDPNHIMGHGFAFSLASRLGAEYPNSGLSFFNRGISGNTILNLKERWQTDVLDLKPDLLSILVGINDFNGFMIKNNGMVSPEVFEQTYQELISVTKEKFPNILIVICSPFLVPVGNYVSNFENLFPKFEQYFKACQKISEENSSIFIDLSQVFQKNSKNPNFEHWIWDGIHPTVAGHELITQAWLKEVRKKVSF